MRRRRTRDRNEEARQTEPQGCSTTGTPFFISARQGLAEVSGPPRAALPAPGPASGSSRAREKERDTSRPSSPRSTASTGRRSRPSQRLKQRLLGGGGRAPPGQRRARRAPRAAEEVPGAAAQRPVQPRIRRGLERDRRRREARSARPRTGSSSSKRRSRPRAKELEKREEILPRETEQHEERMKDWRATQRAINDELAAAQERSRGCEAGMPPARPRRVPPPDREEGRSGGRARRRQLLLRLPRQGPARRDAGR